MEVLLGKNKATVDIEQCTVVSNTDNLDENYDNLNDDINL